MKSKTKLIVVIAFFVTAVNVLTLVSPRVPRGLERANHVMVVDVFESLHLTINLDSIEFMTLARDPRLLLTSQHKIWQSRPLFPVLGFLLSLPFRSLGSQLILPPEFWGYILLNTFLLTVSILLFLWLIESHSLSSNPVILPILIIFAANEVTKAFYWTPHLQIFNILLPIVSLVLFCWLISNLERTSMVILALIGLALGVCSLAYGSFIITMIGSVLICCIIGRKLLEALIIMITFCVPILSWVGFVIIMTGSFYSHEVSSYHQFVWLIDSALKGASFLWMDLSNNLREFHRTLTHVMLLPSLLLIGCTIARSIISPSPHRVCSKKKDLGYAILFYYIAAIPFFGMLGFYATRLSWSLVPPVLVLVGLDMADLRESLLGLPRGMVRAVELSLSLLYVIFWSTTPGPYF